MSLNLLFTLKTYYHNLSLKGITGIIFGILSLLFIGVIRLLLFNFLSATLGIGFLPLSFFEILLVILTLIYLFISYTTITLINKKRRKKQQLRKWDAKAKKIRTLLLFFLLLGGIIIYFLVTLGKLKLIIPASLFLYGIYCFSIKKYTKGPTAFLGFLVIITAILAFIFPNLMFYLWALAFGVFHIIYALFEVQKY